MGKVMKSLSNLFMPKAPKMVAPKVEVPVMPDPESTTARLAARKKFDTKRQRGREGTIYTGGGGSYSNQSLGGTQ